MVDVVWSTCRVVDVLCGMWSMWPASTWYVVDGAWSTGRGRECPHPSTRGEGQGDLRLRVVVGVQKSDVELDHHTSD